jgi:hypothetical protein
MVLSQMLHDMIFYVCLILLAIHELHRRLCKDLSQHKWSNCRILGIIVYVLRKIILKYLMRFNNLHHLLL